MQSIQQRKEALIRKCGIDKTAEYKNITHYVYFKFVFNNSNNLTIKLLIVDYEISSVFKLTEVL